MGTKASQGCPLEIGQVLELQYVLGKGTVSSGISKEQAQAWIGNPKDSAETIATLLTLTPAEALLRLKSIPAVPFPVWMTNHRLGTHKTAKALYRVVKQDCKISNWGRRLLMKTTVAENATSIYLYRATTAELGFTGNAYFTEIRTRIRELGFTDCPAEVGPQLRLQYKNQPMNECVRIIMNPIIGADGNPRVFGLDRDVYGLWLCGCYAGPEDFYRDDVVWVFAKLFCPRGSRAL